MEMSSVLDESFEHLNIDEAVHLEPYFSNLCMKFNELILHTCIYYHGVVIHTEFRQDICSNMSYCH